jgi:hypothetical protein
VIDEEGLVYEELAFLEVFIGFLLLDWDLELFSLDLEELRPLEPEFEDFLPLLFPKALLVVF